MLKFKSVVAISTLLAAMVFGQFAYAETVWIDVRTLEEKQANGISGDPLISYSSIVEGVNQLYPDKETEIYLYCRSGRRAGVALSSLKAAGYNNVTNAGTVGNARKLKAASNQ